MSIAVLRTSQAGARSARPSPFQQRRARQAPNAATASGRWSTASSAASRRRTRQGAGRARPDGAGALSSRRTPLLSPAVWQRWNRPSPWHSNSFSAARPAHHAGQPAAEGGAGARPNRAHPGRRAVSLSPASRTTSFSAHGSTLPSRGSLHHAVVSITLPATRRSLLHCLSCNSSPPSPQGGALLSGVTQAAPLHVAGVCTQSITLSPPSPQGGADPCNRPAAPGQPRLCRHAHRGAGPALPVAPTAG